MNIIFRRMILLAATCFVMPAAVFAQGAISGVARDASGSVLPGVTVEASSPALIERVRTVVTDGQGEYKIVDLHPGTYTVTFKLTGFKIFSREGLDLAADITLPVDAVMDVGVVSQTVTVTSATPVIDLQDTKVSTDFERVILDAVPRHRTQEETAALLPGVVSIGIDDVGGSAGSPTSQLAAHGSDSNDQTFEIDGFDAEVEGGRGARRANAIADGSAEEYEYETDGISAAHLSGGVVSNLVPKEGGNVFHGSILAAGTSQGMTSSNLTSALVARGFTVPGVIENIYDISGSLGGPIIKNKLWFFSTNRNWGDNQLIGGAFFENSTVQAINPTRDWVLDTRLTWQATPRNKFAVYWSTGRRWIPYRSVGFTPPQSPQASVTGGENFLNLAEAKWTMPVSSRLLIDAGIQIYEEHQFFDHSPAWVPGTYPQIELSTGAITGASPAYGGTLSYASTFHDYYDIKSNVSYITGAHSFRFGVQEMFGCSCGESLAQLPTLVYNHGVPFEVQFAALPRATPNHLKYALGFYGQDQWRVHHRWTLNLGFRFDHLNEYLGAQDDPTFTQLHVVIPERKFGAVQNVPNWKDIDPRLGLAWDLFGNGKTAVKFSVSRYLYSDYTSFAGTANPLNTTAGTQMFELVTNTNGSTDPLNWTLGAPSSANFGIPILTTTVDPSLSQGFAKRPYSWEYTASVQQQLLPGWAVTVGYFRRTYGNLTWTDNTILGQANLTNDPNFTPFTITNPISGQPLTMYNLNPSLRGKSNNVIQYAPNNWLHFNGVDVNLNGRFGKGGVLAAGVSMGTSAYSLCTASDPNQLIDCKITPGFFSQNQYKIIGSYPLPYGLHFSGTFTSFAGPSAATNNSSTFPASIGGATPTTAGIAPGIAANYSVTSAIAGITLTNGTITVPLIQPGTVFGDRENEVALRLGRKFTFRESMTLEPYIDVYNLLNASPVRAENFTYGPSWQQPTDVLTGRVLQLGLIFNF